MVKQRKALIGKDFDAFRGEIFNYDIAFFCGLKGLYPGRKTNFNALKKTLIAKSILQGTFSFPRGFKALRSCAEALLNARLHICRNIRKIHTNTKIRRMRDLFNPFNPSLD